MSCPWPECDGNHARCAVLLACLAQVPENGAGTISGWVGGHDMAPTRLSVQGAQFVELVNGDDLLALRSWVAEQVADRLLAWLRWPGAFTCSGCGEVEYRVQSTWTHPAHLAMDCRCGGVPKRRHPLDGTDVAGLRPCTTTRACYGCDGTGANTSLYEWQRDDDEIAEPMSEDCEECHGSGDGFDPDWPAVAVVADYLSSCGGWLWVHDFREPVFGKGLAEVLLPFQAAVDRAVGIHAVEETP